MNKYLQLSEAALNHSKEFYEIKDQCQKVAIQFAQGYRSYLECPEEKIKIIKVDNKLDFTNEETPVSGFPSLTQGTDGVWYFGLQILYKIEGDLHFLYENIRVGIHCGKDVFTIKAAGQNFDVKADELMNFTSVYQYLFDTALKDLSAPVGKKQERIGFIK